MTTTTESTARSVARSIAMGVLLSMVSFYALHVYGTWEVENYRPNTETTFTLLLQNTCAILDHKHTLRPNTGMPVISEGVNGTKLSGSFMNFSDGHVTAMIIFSLVLGALIFVLRSRLKKAI